MTKRINFFDAMIDPLTMDETLARVEEIIRSRQPVQHVVVNVAKLVVMRSNQNFRQIVNACGVINADGQGIVWGARLLGIGIPERVAGIDLFLNLVDLSAKKGYRLYFLGARQEVVDKVVQTFQQKYPGLKIAGFRNGFFSTDEKPGIVQAIRETGADILFVAMSSPNKEYFLSRYQKDLGVPFLMGVGGSFDVVAKVTKRAPVWMQKYGLEWFYRFLCEPGRMWRRYLVTNSIYAGMLIKALLNRERYAKVIES